MPTQINLYHRREALDVTNVCEYFNVVSYEILPSGVLCFAMSNGEIIKTSVPFKIIITPNKH